MLAAIQFKRLSEGDVAYTRASPAQARPSASKGGRGLAALIIEAFPGVVSIAGNALDQIAIGFEDIHIRVDKPDAVGMISQRP